MSDEFGQPYTYDKEGQRITGQDPLFYVDKEMPQTLSDWEVQYYVFVVLLILMCVIMYYTTEDTRLETWAREEILRRRSLRETEDKQAAA